MELGGYIGMTRMCVLALTCRNLLLGNQAEDDGKVPLEDDVQIEYIEDG